MDVSVVWQVSPLLFVDGKTSFTPSSLHQLLSTVALSLCQQYHMGVTDANLLPVCSPHSPYLFIFN